MVLVLVVNGPVAGQFSDPSLVSSCHRGDGGGGTDRRDDACTQLGGAKSFIHTYVLHVMFEYMLCCS